MTDQTVPADLVREIAEKMHHHANQEHVQRDAERYLRIFAKQLDDLLPTPPLPRPTLADMTDDERRECRWMQCDYKGETSDAQSRGVIGYFDYEKNQAVILTTVCGIVRSDYDRVTPRPDLPRMEWPGDTPAPVEPASNPCQLPDGWRLADHPKHGRVIVTTPEAA